MKKVCKYLRNCCLKHEGVANAAMLVGTAVFAGTLGVFILYQQDILAWVRTNPLVNPLIVGAVVAIEVFLIYALSRMVFSDCTEEAVEHGPVYTGRRSNLFPEATSWVESLGKNPKRQ